MTKDQLIEELKKIVSDFNVRGNMKAASAWDKALGLIDGRRAYSSDEVEWIERWLARANARGWRTGKKYLPLILKHLHILDDIPEEEEEEEKKMSADLPPREEYEDRETLKEKRREGYPAEAAEDWLLQGKPLPKEYLWRLGQMVGMATEDPDGHMLGSTLSYKQQLEKYQSIFQYLNTLDKDFVKDQFRQILRYAEPGVGYSQEEEDDLGQAKEYIQSEYSEWLDGKGRKAEIEKFSFNFPVGASTVATRMAPPPNDAIYPLFHWEDELEKALLHKNQGGEKARVYWERFRTGTGRQSSYLTHPTISWLLPYYDWQVTMERIAKLPVEESNYKGLPKGSHWRNFKPSAITVGGNIAYGNDSYLPAEEQDISCNQYESEFTFLNRKITKFGNSNWFIECKHPFAAQLFTVPSNPTMEWGMMLGGISSIVEGSRWDTRRWPGSPGRTDKNGRDTAGGWGWCGKEKPQRDFDLFMWRMHPERQAVEFPNGLTATSLSPYGERMDTMQEFISSAGVFGQLLNSYIQVLGFCEALEVVIRRVEQIEWAYGVAEKPRWIIWA